MGGLDGWALHGPTITGSTLTYGEVTTSCYVSSSRVIAVDLGALRTRTAPVAGILHEYGVSGPDRYALLGASPDPVSSVAPSCSQPGPPCVLQKLTPLQFGPWTRARSARWR